MPRDTWLPQPSPLAISFALLLGFSAVFFIPLHLPVTPAISDSYTFGFNNRAALLLFITFAIAFALWTGGLGLLPRQPQDDAVAPAMSRRLLLITVLITVVATGSLWLAYRRIGAINEGTYLLDRLQHLAAGQRMYRDFEFIYGPLLLWIPLLLHRALGLSLVDAYYASWLIEWTSGVLLLWLTIRWSCATSPRKDGIYVLAFLGFIFSIISLGPNYTPLRFVSAPFFAVLCWRLQSRQSLLPSACIAVAGAAWTLFLSPEQGVALCAATLAFYLFFIPRTRRGYGLSLALISLGQAVLLGLLLRSGVVRYMRGMAAGGYNLPLLPSLNTILLLLLLLVSVCILCNSLRRKVPGGPLEYLTLIGFAALPAAFGRSDAGHMFMNTVGAYIAAWTVLSYHRSAGKWMVWSYLPSALFLPLALYQSNNVVMFPVKAALFSPAHPNPALSHLAQATLYRALGPNRTEKLLAKWRAAYPVVVASNLPPDAPVLAPFGYPSSLLLQGLPPRLSNGRYRGLGNVMVSSEVDDKIQELATQPETLLLVSNTSCPDGAMVAPPSPSERAASDRAKRHELFLNLLPLALPRIKHHDDLLAPLCQYVLANYHATHFISPLQDARILQRNAASR